jgi:hypothetical protein
MIFKRGIKWILKFSDGREEEFFTEESAKKREKQIQGFKHKKETMPNIPQEVKDKYLKKVCSKCPSTKDLGLHHKDHNHENNDGKNLQTLCPSCSTTLHWKEGKTHGERSTIKESFPLRLIESTDSTGFVWDVVLIEAGESDNGADWKAETLKQSLAQFEGTEAFAYEYKGGPHGVDFYDHLPESVRNSIPGGTALKNKVGDYSNIRYETFEKADGSTGEGILAQFRILESARWLRDYIKDSFNSGRKSLGFSIDALTRWTKRLKENGRWIKDVLEIGKVDEITVVSKPGAGGMLLRLLMSKQKQEVEMFEKLFEWLKKHYPDQHKRVQESFTDKTTDDEKLATVLTVFEKLKESGLDVEKKLAAAVEAGKKNEPGKKTKKEEIVFEGMTQESFDKKVNEAVEAALEIVNTAAAKITQGKQILESKLAESKGIPELEKSEITIEYGDKGLTAEEIDSMLARKQSKWAKAQESGLYVPDQEKQLVTIKDDEYDKMVRGLTGLLIDETIDKTPPYHTLQESYKQINKMSGDREEIGMKMFGEIAVALPSEQILATKNDPHGLWRGVLRESRSGQSNRRLQEAQLTTSLWTEVYGDSVRRAMMREYDRDQTLNSWRDIVSLIGSAPDFRTNRRQRIGGFGNLSIVNEGGTYQEIDFPTDDEVTYAVQKRGGLANMTMESIIDDDLGAVRMVPRKLGVAAIQTLHEFVFDFIADNGAVDYDSVALFHADHGNLGSVALASTAFDDRVFAMNQQTEQDSGKPLGVDPVIILIPAELRKTAWEIVNSVRSVDGRTDTTDNWVKTFNLKIIQVNYWTDATNWYLVGDPRKYPTIEIDFLRGRQEPEIFIQDQPTIGSVFSADKVTYKIRHIYGGDVLDHRALDGNVVAG